MEFETWFNVQNILSGGVLEDKKSFFEDCWNKSREGLAELEDKNDELTDENGYLTETVDEVIGDMKDAVKSLKNIDNSLNEEEIFEKINDIVDDLEDNIHYYETV